MAVTSLEVPLRADARRRTTWHFRLPRWALPALMALCLLGVLATAGARISYAANYAPLKFEGASFGPRTAGFKPVGDGFATTRWLLTAKPGATATFQYGLTNSGSDPVTIYDVKEPPSDWLYMSYGWSSATVYGDDPHKLPVVLQPHQSIEFLLSIRQPPCALDTALTEIRALYIRYGAFGFTHDLIAPMVGEPLEPIEVCWQSRLGRAS